MMGGNPVGGIVQLFSLKSNKLEFPNDMLHRRTAKQQKTQRKETLLMVIPLDVVFRIDQQLLAN